MKKLILIISLCIISISAFAQTDSTLVEFDVPLPNEINDYSLLGVNYGAGFSRMYFNPTKRGQTFLFQPNYLSVTYTKFSKMFDKMPYFALVVGAAYGKEGFQFVPDEETGIAPDVDGASTCTIETFEIPALAQIHADFYPGKIMANAGVYAGWRRSIERSGLNLDPKWTNSFRDYENQFDYGLQGGAGFALMLDPIEIHFNCLVRWSWQSLYQPDYSSRYYYRYAYPLDIMATVGIHYQLTKRSGRTNRQLKKEAYNRVYGKAQDNSRQSR